MTVSSTTFYTDWSAANGVITEWGYDFQIDLSSEVQVLIRDGTDDTTIEVFTDNLTLVPIGDGDEGYVIYPASGDPVPTGKQVRIRRIVALTQTTEIGNEGDFRPQIHEKAFDKLTKACQQINGNINGALKILGDGTGYYVNELIPGTVLAYIGGFIQSGPSINEVANAQGYALEAKSYRDDTIGLKGEVIVLKDGMTEDIGTALGEFDVIKGQAETARNFAYNWASAPEDELVDDGVRTGNSSYHWSRKSRLWSMEAEDVEVAPGEYSAYHWAKKAEEIVTAGVADGSITIAKLSSDVVDLIESNVRYMASGIALPTENVGPIFHEDYGCILTWQVFNANGADYTGYASEEIGMLADDGRSTPRRGWLERNGATLAKADFPALWNWALHVGQTVALGTWAVGKGFFAEVDTTNFKLPDTRGWFKRPFSNGATMDSGRSWGSSQDDQNEAHTHSVSATGTTDTEAAHSHSMSGPVTSSTGAGTHYAQLSASAPTKTASTSGAGAHAHSVSVSGTAASSGGNESRPNNTTTLDVIKF